MKYFAIGTPIGILNEGSSRYFFRQGALLNMDGSAFRIWTQFLHGNTPLSVLNDKQILSRYDKEEIEQKIHVLIDATMLVNDEDLYTHVPMRQGYGVGFDPHDSMCTIYLNGAVRVSYDAFLLWSYCDGVATLADVVKKLPNELAHLYTKQRVLSATEELLRSNLLLFAS